MPVYKKIAWSTLALSAISFFIVLAFQNNNVSTYPVGWDKSYPITPYDLYIKNIRLAQKGNIIAVVYEAERNKASGIYVSLSFDKGIKFFQPVKIASISPGTDRNPDISVSPDGHIAVVWQELSEEDPNSRLYYSISGDMGATWTEPALFKSRTEMELLPKALYDDRGRLHIFYNAYKEKGFNLFHIVSEDEKNFSEPKSIAEISEGLRGAFFPAIHESGSYIYLVWQGKEKTAEALSDDLYFIKSGDFGRTWTQKRLITKSRSKDSSPFITSYKNEIFLVYQNDETKNWAIKLMKGTERGDKWEEPVTVSTTNADCYSPRIVGFDDETLFIAWYDTRNKTPGVFVRKFPPQIQNPAPEVMLSRANVPARKPLIVSAGRKILVLWEESGRLILKNSDVSVEPPVVYSQTHPENAWSKLSRAVIKWKPPKDESNITGYAILLKRAEDYNLPDIDPTIPNIAGNITEYQTPELEDGISYFNIRAIDGAGNYSRTVRYKIQVSKNPPSMPVVTSRTHPDGKASESATAILNWTTGEKVRIKGFLYAVSKDTIKAPDKFTPDYEAKFDNLSEGRHFFSIRSVDRTNTLSPVVVYEIIVGRAEKLDPGMYSKLAQGIVEEKPGIVRKPVRPKLPSVELVLPFDVSLTYDKPSFDAEIKLINIEKKELIGYSYFIGKKNKKVPDIINLTDNMISVKDLKNGEYYIGLKGRYTAFIKNKKEFFWTEPVIKRFKIEIPVQEPVLVYYIRLLVNRLIASYIPVSMSLIIMALSIITLGFGARLSFYAKLFRLKFVNVFRIFL